MGFLHPVTRIPMSYVRGEGKPIRRKEGMVGDWAEMGNRIQRGLNFLL